MAPAGPGGGYDQLARATQQVLEKHDLASGVQVQNIPGAGGTIGLAQFVTKNTRTPTVMVAGLGLVGAILTNKSPVTLDQVTPLARLTGEYQPLVVAADSPLKSLDDLLGAVQGRPRLGELGRVRRSAAPTTSSSALIVQAAGGDVAKMNYIVAGAGGEMLAQVMGGHITVATGGLNEMAAADPGRQAAGARHLVAGTAAGRRHPDLQGTGHRRDAGQLARGDGAGQDASRRPEGARCGALARSVQTAEWQALLKERGWVDMYQPSAEFAAFLGHGAPAHRGRSSKQVGLVK